MLVENVDDDPSTYPEAVDLLPEGVGGLRPRCSPSTPGALRLRRATTRRGGRPRGARAGREARPARAGVRRDHHAERPEEGRAQGRGSARRSSTRSTGRLRRRHPRRAPRPVPARPFLRGLGRVGRGRDVVPQRDEGRRPTRASPGRRTASSPLAAGVDQDRRGRLGRGAAADRHQRRAGAADPVRAGREHRAGGRGRRAASSGRAGPGAAPVLGARGRGRDHSVVVEMVDAAPRATTRPSADRGLPATPSRCSAGSGTSGSAPASGSRPSRSVQSPSRCRGCQRAERATCWPRWTAARRGAHGLTSTRPVRPLGSRGPGLGQRLDAETLRPAGSAGIDAPPQEALVEAWREAEALFAEFGHVHELATVRAVLAGILRATGDPAAARELGDRPARSPTGSVPSRCWTTACPAAPPARADGRRPTP